MESETRPFFQSLMALPGNHAVAQGGQGGGALGGSDMQPVSPPFAPPSLVRRDYLRAQHQHTLELQDNVHISAVVLINTHLTDKIGWPLARWWIVKRWLPQSYQRLKGCSSLCNKCYCKVSAIEKDRTAYWWLSEQILCSKVKYDLHFISWKPFPHRNLSMNTEEIVTLLSSIFLMLKGQWQKQRHTAYFIKLEHFFCQKMLSWDVR